MKKHLQKIYNVVILRREIKTLKKQIKEITIQINTMIKNAKELCRRGIPLKYIKIFS